MTARFRVKVDISSRGNVGSMQAIEPRSVVKATGSTSESERWNAILQRDERYDGMFVFAVKSTGIYCRPSCPAKRAGRDQIRFYPSVEDAEDAGYRPCKRCRPRELSTKKARLIENVTRYIDANLDKKVTLSMLSLHAGLNPYHLQRTFKQALGISPREYVQAQRLMRMKRSLTRGETVNSSLYNAGFSSRSRVYGKENPGFGVSPGTFRRGGQGLQVKYTIVDSPLGRLLIGATERGVCAICIGATDDTVEASLKQDYYAAYLHRDDSGLREWTVPFQKYFSQQPFTLKLPVDVQATAFQWKVWNQIRAIPYGQTASYRKIARGLGKPDAVRAVARACASNPVALVIPCHRVVGSDGELHGYRWGIRRKQALLIHEKMTQSGMEGSDYRRVIYRTMQCSCGRKYSGAEHSI